MNYEKPILMVDIIILTVINNELSSIFFKRDKDPFIGEYTFAGGWVHVDQDKSVEDTAERVLREKLNLRNVYIEQLKTFSGDKRDSRGWSATVAYLALVNYEYLLENNPEFKKLLYNGEVIIKNIDNVDNLPFDHSCILQEAIIRLRGKGLYSTMPVKLLPNEFTFEEMRNIYEIVTKTKIDQSSFRRKIMELGVVEKTKNKKKTLGRYSEILKLKDNISTFNKKI